ncbi:hypothetical protein ALC53_09654 [Atta colombica]|uniref:Uncharacterized protein n=1 Tax=Atta colombica TaxID=520822 RepID=A0A151I193_9HYME|nr:hypothetical protein ALC53_09654 [Atta colombica]
MKYNNQQGGLESPLAFKQGSGDTLGNLLGGIDSRVERAMRLKAVRSDMKNNCTLFAVQLNVCRQLHTGVIDIDSNRSRELRMQKKFLFLGISTYMDHEEHVVASLMKRRKSFLVKESAARAIGAECQLVKNTDRYPYVLNSMQQVFISAQYLPFPKNSLPT